MPPSPCLGGFLFFSVFIIPIQLVYLLLGHSQTIIRNINLQAGIRYSDMYLDISLSHLKLQSMIDGVLDHRLKEQLGNVAVLYLALFYIMVHYLTGYLVPEPVLLYIKIVHAVL